MSREPFHYEPYIEKAKQTPGAHLHIGRGGFTLHSGTSRLSGYDSEAVKAACVAAKLPVIDSRKVPIDIAAKLSVSGPMIAVNTDPDPRPWHAFSYAPLGVVAAAYRKAGAEVFNIAEDDLDETVFPALPDGPLKDVIDGWLDYVRNSEF
jgi:hypothetical protein